MKVKDEQMKPNLKVPVFYRRAYFESAYEDWVQKFLANSGKTMHISKAES